MVDHDKLRMSNYFFQKRKWNRFILSLRLFVLNMDTRQPQKGFFLIEVLVIILLFSIVGYSFLSSGTYMSKNLELNIHNGVATQIALDELEKFSRVDPSTLTEANSYSDIAVRDAMSFNRGVNIAVNLDGSRTVTVQLQGVSPKELGSASISNNYALWGTQ